PPSSTLFPYTTLFRSGVVPGGGVALLYAIKVLKGLEPQNDDQKVGIDIVRRALQAPARQIAENAGADGSIVVGKLLESKDSNFGDRKSTRLNSSHRTI